MFDPIAWKLDLRSCIVTSLTLVRMGNGFRIKLFLRPVPGAELSIIHQKSACLSLWSKFIRRNFRNTSTRRSPSYFQILPYIVRREYAHSWRVWCKYPWTVVTNSKMHPLHPSLVCFFFKCLAFILQWEPRRQVDLAAMLTLNPGHFDLLDTGFIVDFRFLFSAIDFQQPDSESTEHVERVLL